MLYILKQEDMHERCLDMIDGEVRRVVDAHTVGNLPEEWDLDGLVKVFPQASRRIEGEVPMHRPILTWSRGGESRSSI